MKREERGGNSSSGRVWIWLLLLVILLSIVKLLFLGTYYVGASETSLPSGIPPKSLLFVALQGTPQSDEDLLLVELEQRVIAPVQFLERDNDTLTVVIGETPINVSMDQVRGRVIGVLRL